MIKPHSSFSKLIYMYRDGRDKMPHDPFHRMDGDTPYSEKPKYMINTEGVEIIAHLFKSPPPPFKMVPLHLFPVIGWKAPVLPLHRKIIRGSTCLPIHIIQIGINPGITTIAINTDRDITFQNNSFFMTITRCFFQLPVQMELCEIME